MTFTRHCGRGGRGPHAATGKDAQPRAATRHFWVFFQGCGQRINCHRSNTWLPFLIISLMVPFTTSPDLGRPRGAARTRISGLLSAAVCSCLQLSALSGAVWRSPDDPREPQRYPYVSIHCSTCPDSSRLREIAQTCTDMYIYHLGKPTSPHPPLHTSHLARSVAIFAAL